MNLVKIELAAVALACAAVAGTIRAESYGLDTLNLKYLEQGWGEPHANRSVDNHPLFLDGKKFEHGVGTHAVSTFRIALNGKGDRFTATVGVDDEVGQQGSVEFKVIGDGRTLWESGVLRGGDHAKEVSASVQGVKTLLLRVGGVYFRMSLPAHVFTWSDLEGNRLGNYSHATA